MKELENLLNTTLGNMMSNAKQAKTDYIPWYMGEIPSLIGDGIVTTISNTFYAHLMKFACLKKTTVYRFTQTHYQPQKEIVDTVEELKLLGFFTLFQDITDDSLVLAHDEGFISFNNIVGYGYKIESAFLSSSLANATKKALSWKK